MVQILDKQIAIYIPSTNGNRQIDSTRYVNRALKLFSNLFGGSTEYRPRDIPARGAWIDQNDSLISEDINIVESYTDKRTLAQNIETVRQWTIELKAELHQESIALKVNNKLELH